MRGSYTADLYPFIAHAEKNHFWFRARRRLLFHLIQKTIPDARGKTFLEIGCGTGGLLPVFQKLGFRVTGMDMHKEALSHARRVSSVRLIKASFPSYKTTIHYDVLGLFDVVEHQADDRRFLSSCRALLRKHGILFLSVPACPWLWTGIDDASGHMRRYTKRELVKKLKKAGFSIEFCNYWNCLLLGWYVLWRWQYLFHRGKSQIKTYVTIPPYPINLFFLSLLLLEEWFFFHTSVPIGSSLFVVARKL